MYCASERNKIIAIEIGLFSKFYWKKWWQKNKDNKWYKQLKYHAQRSSSPSRVTSHRVAQSQRVDVRSFRVCCPLTVPSQQPHTLMHHNHHQPPPPDVTPPLDTMVTPRYSKKEKKIEKASTHQAFVYVVLEIPKRMILDWPGVS